MGIHEPTLLATLAVASLISGLIFAWLARFSPKTPGPAYWAAGALCIGIAILWERFIDDWRIAALVFDIPLTGGFVFQLAGTLLFCGHKNVRAVLYVGLALVMLITVVFTFVVPVATLRIPLLAGIAAVASLWSAVVLSQQAPGVGSATFRVAAAARALQAGASATQAVLVFSAGAVSYGSPEVPIAALIGWSTLMLNTLLCDPMLLMLVVLRLLGELREASEHDALTGLLNRRGLRAALDKLASAQGNAARRPMAVLLIDVDHFKAVNDRHGHEIGDKVLVTVGNVLGTANADHMHAVRWGGEEFCVVAANMERAAAVDLAERIRTRFNEASRQIPELSDGVTISVGVAAATVDTISGVMNLVSAADTALYAAKNAGRNRVEVAVGGAKQRVAA